LSDPAWADNRPKLDPDRLVFIDETKTSTNMARRSSPTTAERSVFLSASTPEECTNYFHLPDTFRDKWKLP
jgi:hypothetical protein